MDNAKLYVSSNGLQKRDALVVLNEYLPQMEWRDEGERVLDVGCGSGDVTRNLLMPLLPPTVESITGVDISRDMVNFANKHFHHNMLNFQQIDIDRIIQPRMVFPDGFSKIFSLYCLHWVKDQQNCLNNLYQLLQPGGETLLVFLAKNPLFTMYENISMTSKWAQYMKDVSNFIPSSQYQKNPSSDLASLAEEVGFNVLFCETPEFNFVFENINYLLSAIKAVNPFLPRIPSDLQDSFINDCLEELVRLSPKNDAGHVIARYHLMIAHFQREDIM